MTLIVDNCVAGVFFLGEGTSPYRELRELLISGNVTKLVVVTGGKAQDELFGNHAVKRLCLQLERAGRLKLIPASRADAHIDSYQSKIEQGKAKSDDPHLLSLAHATGARWLCSADQKFVRDFKHRDVLPQPRGRVYKNANHLGLLRSSLR
jgi:hypothetical protein